MFGPALIPAAGHSVRMGRPKLLLLFDGQTILQRLLDATRQGGAERAVVVVRSDDIELANAAVSGGADVVRLPSDTSEMRATVIAGLDWIETHLPANERTGFFLIPADHPVLSPEIFRAISAAIDGSASIVLPVHAGRRGHPVWIAWSHVPALRELPEGEGINAYLRSQAAVIREIPWPTPDILLDLDTPADYEALLQQRANFNSGREHTTPSPPGTPGGEGRGEGDQNVAQSLGRVAMEAESPNGTPSPSPPAPRPRSTGGEGSRLPTLLSKNGQRLHAPPYRPRAILPGSFNPAHAGHWGLAAAAREILGHEVDFELSRRNVDKPELDDAEVVRRAAQFVGRANLWVTHAPRFVEKSAHFPAATFVIGADTAVRIVDARYHEEDAARLTAALDLLAETGCRFLVASRLDAQGTFLSLGDLAIPERWRHLFAAIPESLFRLDISSTQLRAQP